jgi:hypothetical protein
MITVISRNGSRTLASPAEEDAADAAPGSCIDLYRRALPELQRLGVARVSIGRHAEFVGWITAAAVLIVERTRAGEVDHRLAATLTRLPAAPAELGPTFQVVIVAADEVAIATLSAIPFSRGGAC